MASNPRANTDFTISNASGGPAGVGVAVGRAIRLSIVSVVVLNLLLSLLFWGGGNTVSLTG